MIFAEHHKIDQVDRAASIYFRQSTLNNIQFPPPSRPEKGRVNPMLKRQRNGRIKHSRSNDFDCTGLIDCSVRVKLCEIYPQCAKTIASPKQE